MFYSHLIKDIAISQVGYYSIATEASNRGSDKFRIRLIDNYKDYDENADAVRCHLETV